MKQFKTSQSGIDIEVEEDGIEIGGLVLCVQDNREGQNGRVHELNFNRAGKVTDSKFWLSGGHCETYSVRDFRKMYGEVVDNALTEDVKAKLSGMYQGEQGIQRIVMDGPDIRVERRYL
ncbi:MAG: hypothetical protein AABX33_01705 [Nanoarchaeota archaeon]